MDPTRRRLLTAIGAAGGVAAGLGLAACRDAPRPDPGARGAAPTRTLITRWRRDPFSLGSYSALPVGSGPADRRALGRPFGPIHIAGEATDLDAPATVHGALASGTRAAAAVAASTATGGRVVVVGAGASGLAAGSALAGSHRVTVLDARDRTGGRVHTDRTTGAPLELGAAWIHGPVDNPLVELARAAGVATVPFDWSDARVVAPTGTPADTGATEALADVFAALDDRDDLRDLTVAEAVAVVTEELGLDAGTRAALDRLVVTEIEGESALSASRLGVAGWTEGTEPVGGDLLVVGGYDRILEPLTAGVEIRTGTPVERIEWSDADTTARVLGPELDEPADAVILTVPVAVLRSGRPELAGPVPSWWSAALARIETGTLDKVVLLDPRRPDGAPARPPTLVTQWWGTPRGRFAEWIDLQVDTGIPAVVTLTAGDAAVELEALGDDVISREAAAVADRIST